MIKTSPGQCPFGRRRSGCARNGRKCWARWPGTIRFSFFCATAVSARRCWEEFGSFRNEDQSRNCWGQRICRTGIDQAHPAASCHGICGGHGRGGNRRKAAAGHSSAAARNLQSDHFSSGRRSGWQSLELDTVFLCTPDKVSYDLVPKILSLGIRVIDFSGAFRLKDVASYSVLVWIPACKSRNCCGRPSTGFPNGTPRRLPRRS